MTKEGRLDLTNPQHVEELRWACRLSEEDRRASLAHVEAHPVGASHDEVTGTALRTLADPERSAELLRALLERSGVYASVECPRGRQWRVVYYVGAVRMWFATSYANGDMLPDIPRVVLGLLDAENEAQALAALHGSGR